MNASATAAQTLWLTSNLKHGVRFARALRDPEATQSRWLSALVQRDAPTHFGQAHDFAKVKDYRAFSRNVPLTDYCDVEPWIQRIQRSEKAVLTTDAVTHLVPTSGTSGARKLIPFTATLKCSFSAAVGAWLCDLIRRRPATLLGPSYWAVSPHVGVSTAENQPSALPVGFADDADYLTGFAAWLVRQALAVPSLVRHAKSVETWKRATLLCLLRQRDLRLISIWHPSYLELITAEAAKSWDELCRAIASGDDPWLGQLRATPAPGRARELARVGPADPAAWWPRLQIISCWGEQAADPGWRRLCSQFPATYVQPKGLLATEAAVTLPWGGFTPLAVTSHFFEFICECGEVRRAHELETGRTYEVVVTNGGGLWRYRLGDRVECTGRLAATPCLRFVGRAGNVVDLRGEKLSESFVAHVLDHLWPREQRPVFGQLRATVDSTHAEKAGYELHVSTCDITGLAERLDAALCANPHYAWARQLGQLRPIRVVQTQHDVFGQAQAENGDLAALKPRVLVNEAAANS